MKSTVLKSTITGLVLAAATGAAWADKADDTLNVAFTKELENLGVGTYSVCFTVNGYEYFEQCFSCFKSI